MQGKRAGWVSGWVWLTHALAEEWALVVALTPVYACILWFPLRLHGSFVALWVTLMVHTCFGISAPPPPPPPPPPPGFPALVQIGVVLSIRSKRDESK